MTLKYFYREPNRVRLQPANPTLDPIYTIRATSRFKACRRGDSARA